MTRLQERKHLSEIVERKVPFITHHDKLRLVTALLDGGFRYNPTVLHEAAESFRKADPGLPYSWLKDRARELEAGK